MSLYRHPDAAIAAWLDDGPIELSRGLAIGVKTSIRATRQRSVVVLPLPLARRGPSWRALFAAGAIVLALVTGVAIAAGMWPPNDSTPSPTTSADPQAKDGLHILPADRKGVATSTVVGGGWRAQLEYTIPDSWQLAVMPLPGGDGRQALAFTLDGGAAYAAGAGGRGRGIVVSDVTGATTHYNNGVIVGERDARTFLTRLAETELGQFDVGEVSATSVAGLPALTATVSRGHVDNAGGLDFRMPSQIIAADYRGGILVVQIWAETEAALAAWVPEARGFIATFTLVDPGTRTCWTNPPTPLQLPAIGALHLPGTAISVEYTLPPGADFAAASQPGVVGLALGGAAGLSYESGPFEAGRGIIIAEALSATAHGDVVRPPFGTDARSILIGIEAQNQFVLTSYPGSGPSGLLSRGVMVIVEQNIGSLPSHIDRVGPFGRDCLVDFSRSNLTSLVDVAGQVVLFQIWATSDAELEAWLPDARAFIESMRIVVGGGS